MTFFCQICFGGIIVWQKLRRAKPEVATEGVLSEKVFLKNFSKFTGQLEC